MSKECLFAVMYNMSIFKKSNSCAMHDTHNFNFYDWLQSVVSAWRYLHRSWIYKQNWIIWLRSRFIWLLVTWHDLPINPSIHPTTHTPTHRWGVRTNHKSANRIELSIRSIFIWFLVIWHNQTHVKHGCLHGGGHCHFLACSF